MLSSKRKCECGGHINSWAIPKGKEEVYKDLYVCIDCFRNYIFKNNTYKFISNAEFRRIVWSRENK